MAKPPEMRLAGAFDCRLRSCSRFGVGPEVLHCSVLILVQGGWRLLVFLDVMDILQMFEKRDGPDDPVLDTPSEVRAVPKDRIEARVRQLEWLLGSVDALRVHRLQFARYVTA